MHILDALGQPCPLPVVRAKKAMLELSEGESMQILVDNAIACENLKKMADGLGYAYEMEQEAPDRFAVALTKQKAAQAAAPIRPDADASKSPAMQCAPDEERFVVAIGRDSMGAGSDELGSILIKGFLFSLAQLETPPSCMILFNGGVKLARKASKTWEDIRNLADAGCEVILCGTCVNYYGVADEIAVGGIDNMYGIVERMSAATRLLQI